MFQRHNPQVVALAQDAIRIRDQLGHHEQADALGACHAVGQARQHKVTHILREIIIGPTDVNLLARNRIGSVPVGHRL